MIVGGDAARESISPMWGSLLILIVSGAHYGATLLRVYEHRAERDTYRIFTVYGTFAMLAMLLGALYSPMAGSLLISLYLTWSPWHCTGQNYGIMCVASAINLHHFVLDGAIWKLRNPKIANVLLRSHADRSSADNPTRAGPWKNRAAWTFADFFCLANIVPEIEIEHRFPRTLISEDYEVSESILDRAAYYGRDSSGGRARLANGRLPGSA